MCKFPPLKGVKRDVAFRSSIEATNEYPRGGNDPTRYGSRYGRVRCSLVAQRLVTVQACATRRLWIPDLLGMDGHDELSFFGQKPLKRALDVVRGKPGKILRQRLPAGTESEFVHPPL